MKALMAALAATLLSGTTHADIQTCDIQSILPQVNSFIEAYVQAEMKEKNISYKHDSLFIGYKGKGDVIDDMLMKKPAVGQNLFEVYFETEGGSKLTLLTVAQGLCKNSADLCYFLPDQDQFALPEPQVVYERNPEGVPTAKFCELKSHAGFNRYSMIYNHAQSFDVIDELISLKAPTVARVQMPLP